MLWFQIRCGSSCTLIFITLLSSAPLFTIICLLGDYNLYFYLYLFNFNNYFYFWPHLLCIATYSFLVQLFTYIKNFLFFYKSVFQTDITLYLQTFEEEFSLPISLLTLHLVAVHPGSYRGIFASLLGVQVPQPLCISEILGIFHIQFLYHYSWW